MSIKKYKLMKSVVGNEDETIYLESSSDMIKHESSTVESELKSIRVDLNNRSLNTHTHDQYLTSHQDISGKADVSHVHNEYVPTTRKINGIPLNNDINIKSSDIADLNTVIKTIGSPGRIGYCYITEFTASDIKSNNKDLYNCNGVISKDILLPGESYFFELVGAKGYYASGSKIDYGSYLNGWASQLTGCVVGGNIKTHLPTFVSGSGIANNLETESYKIDVLIDDKSDSNNIKIIITDWNFSYNRSSTANYIPLGALFRITSIDNDSYKLLNLEAK